MNSWVTCPALASFLFLCFKSDPPCQSCTMFCITKPRKNKPGTGAFNSIPSGTKMSLSFCQLFLSHFHGDKKSDWHKEPVPGVGLLLCLPGFVIGRPLKLVSRENLEKNTEKQNTKSSVFFKCRLLGNATESSEDQHTSKLIVQAQYPMLLFQNSISGCLLLSLEQKPPPFWCSSILPSGTASTSTPQRLTRSTIDSSMTPGFSFSGNY